MYRSQSKYHSDCAKEVKISEEEFRLWVDVQESKIRGLVKLLDHTLVRYHQIEQEIEDSVLELTGNYDILKRKFTELTRGYYDGFSGREYRYFIITCQTGIYIKRVRREIYCTNGRPIAATEEKVRSNVRNLSLVGSQ